MKKSLVTLIMLVGISLVGYAQVGINNVPQATLDVAKSSDTKFPDGVLVPRVTVKDLDDKDALYLEGQHGSLVYVIKSATNSDNTSTKNKTKNITSSGFYFFSYDKTTPSNSSWKRITSDHGYGSFTPKVKSFDLPGTANLDDYGIGGTYEKDNYNYFEFTSASQSFTEKHTIKFPTASAFADKTIYIKSYFGSAQLNLGLFFSNVPSELDNLTRLPQEAVLQLYSNGTRWYLMSGRYFTSGS